MDLGIIKRAKKQSIGADFMGKILDTLCSLVHFQYIHTHTHTQSPAGVVLSLTLGKVRGRK